MTNSMKDVPTLLDYYVELYQNRKRLLINFLIVAIVGGVVAFLLPKWYKATTTILPPSQQFGGFSMSALQSALPMGALSFLGGGDETLTYVAILESYSAMEAVAKKFNLTELYEAEHIQKTVTMLRSNVDIELSPEGTIIVEVYDTDPHRAADIANAFVFYLDSLNTNLKTKKAHNNRLFIEKRFTQNKEDLRRAEETMRAFQEAHGAMALSAQTEAAIAAAAELEAQIIAADVELNVQKKYLSPHHTKLINLENLLAELKNQERSLTYGDHQTMTNGNSDGKRDFNIFIPFSELPELGVQYVRNLREVEVQNQLYKFFLEQYELAKLEESRQTPTVEVLDAAKPPWRKDKPKRALVAIFSGLSASFIYVMLLCVNLRLRFLQQTDPAKHTKLVSSLPLLNKRSKEGE